MPARKEIPIADLMDMLDKDVPVGNIARLYRTTAANVEKQIAAHQKSVQEKQFQEIEDEIVSQMAEMDAEADQLALNEILHPNARALLLSYKNSGNLTAAARAAQVSRQSHYVWLEMLEGYAEAFNAAKEMFADTLEAAALMRGRDGVLEPVFQGGMQVGTIRRYSDAMLLALLKAKKPEEYKERTETTHAGKVQYAHSLDGDLSALSVAKLKALREIARELDSVKSEVGDPVA